MIDKIFHGDSLCLPERLRPLLAVPPPSSLLLAEPERHSQLRHAIVASVGDFVSRRLLSAGIFPRLVVVDCGTRRSVGDCSVYDDYTSYYEVKHVVNPRSSISVEAARIIFRSLAEDKRVLVLVSGEEDLLALPAIAASPQGLYVVYGYPSVASIAVRVDDWVKRVVLNTLKQFIACQPKG